MDVSDGSGAPLEMLKRWIEDQVRPKNNTHETIGWN